METKFEDLPAAVQAVAANTLQAILVSKLSDYGEVKIEPAKKLARGINAAFLELASPSELESADSL